MLEIQVPPSYPLGCKIVFVGEAPGKEEVDAKEGFVGAAGRALQRACSIAGLEWSQCGKTNIAKRRPSDNKFKEAFYETIEEPIYTPTGKLSKKTRKVTQPTAELRAWQANLVEELRQQRVNLVVAMGNEALETLTGVTGITNYRGSILPTLYDPNCKVLACEHPSYILRGNHRDFWILAHDLKKAKREMEFPEVRREPYVAMIAPELTKNWILDLLELVRKFPDMKWTLDVETRAGTLACFAIAFQGEDAQPTAFCIPIQTTSGAYWSPQEEMEIWRALYETCNSNPNLCNQNIEYDIYYLLRYGVEPSGVWMDTMLAHSILYPEFPKGLDFLCSFYLDDVVYYKGEGRNWGAGDRDPELWEYCCKDAVYTLRVVEKIDEELKRRGLHEAYHGAH